MKNLARANLVMLLLVSNLPVATCQLPMPSPITNKNRTPQFHIPRFFIFHFKAIFQSRQADVENVETPNFTFLVFHLHFNWKSNTISSFIPVKTLNAFCTPTNCNFPTIQLSKPTVHAHSLICFLSFLG